MLLSSLTGIRSGLVNSDLPSWAPDWSVEDPLSEVASWDKHCAAHSSLPSFTISPDEKLLTLSGMIIDTIDVVSSAYPTAQDLRERAGKLETYPVRKDEVRVFKDWFRTFGTGDRRRVLAAWFSEFVHADWTRTYEDSCPCAETLESFWVKCINRFHPSDGVDFALPLKIEKMFSESGGSSEMSKDEIKQSIIQFHAIVRKLSDRKIMFKTYGGNIGIGSHALKSGDKIALFSGCNLPMIIRPLGKHWRMICPAYVQHAMRNCEAWTSGGYLLEDYTFV